MQRFLSNNNQGGDNNEWHSKLVGKVILDDNEETTLSTEQFIRKKDLPTPHRIVPPNSMVTQDFRPERLNINIDHSKKVTGCKFG